MTSSSLSSRHSADLEALDKHIQEETAKVTHRLEQVEPAVQDAKAAVSSIKRQHLVEIRTMGNPPKGCHLIALKSGVYDEM